MARRLRDTLVPTPAAEFSAKPIPAAASRTAGARAAAGAAGLVLLTSVACAAAALLLGRLLASLPSTLGTARVLPVDRWVEVVVTAGGAVAAAWLAITGGLALVCVAAARLGRTWRSGEALLRQSAPAIVRRLARTAVGVGVGTGLALVPATAHAAGATEPATPDPTAVVTTFDLGWQSTTTSDVTAPDTADTAPTTDDVTTAAVTEPDHALASEPVPSDLAAVRAARPPAAPDGTYVVHRGDTLWDIATTTLDDEANAADVMRAVVQWHDANRDVIGDDPDVILPGQVLRAPA